MSRSTDNSNWTERALGEIADVIMGRQLSPSKKLGVRPRPYLRAANIGTWGISLDDILEMDFTETEEKHFSSVAGDVLMVEGGNEKSVGCPALVTKREEGLCIQNTVIRCRVKDTAQLLPEYLYQFLRMSFWNGQFAELCAGTTIMHLGQKRAVAHSVSFPPLSEQERIVDVINSVDSYIAALQQKALTARAARYAVLHEVLTVGGDGWTERALGEIADVIMGRQLSPSKKLGVRPRPYLRAANIGTWGISLDDILEMDFTETEEKHFSSVAGDVLMVEGGNEKSVGCPALVTKREEGLCIQNTVIRCRVKDTAQLLPEYLYQFLRMSFWNGQFAELCAGTTIMHLGQKRAVAHSVSFPPLSEQERIVGVVSAMDDVVRATEKAVSSAHELRSVLLFDLLSGDHEIPGTYDRLLGVA